MASQPATTAASSVGLGRDFWLYRIGQGISVVGDSCGAIALAWWILDMTGSAAAMSSVLAPAMVIRIGLTVLLGPVGDRVARKRLIALSDSWRGVFTLVLAILAFQGRFMLPQVIVLYGLIAIGSALYGPASTSIVPQLVPNELLPRAFQQSQAIASAGSIVGGVLGGALVSAVGVPGAFAIDVVTFFVGALTAQLIRAETRPAGRVVSEGAGAAGANSWRRDLSDGFRFLYAARVLFVLALVAMLLNFVLAPLAVVLPVLVKEGRGLPAWYLGTLRSSMGIGAIIGAVLMGWVCRTFKTDRAVVFGIGLMGAAVASLSWGSGFGVPLVAMLFLGVASSLANIPIMSQLAAATPDMYRTRLNSILLFLAQGIGPVGVALAGVCLATFGLAPTLLVMGGATLLLGPMLLIIPHLSEFFRQTPHDVGRYLEARYPNAFRAQVHTRLTA